MAKAIGDLTSQAISQWKKVPVERVLVIERLSGISRHELRPDIYGPPQDADRVSTAGAACDLVAAPAFSAGEAA